MKLEEYIKKLPNGKWAVCSKKTGKVLGTHDTKAQAVKQLQAIEINKKKEQIEIHFFNSNYID